MEYGDNEVVVDIAAMKTNLELEAPFTHKSQVGRMRVVSGPKGQFVEELAILPMALFVNALRFENISRAKSRSEVIKIVVNDSHSGYRKSVA
jgi:hypothetical protein